MDAMTQLAVKVPVVMVELVADVTDHRDRVYGTGAVWARKGSIAHVPAAAWAKMRLHEDVYRLAPAAAAAPAKSLDDLVVKPRGIVATEVSMDTGEPVGEAIVIEESTRVLIDRLGNPVDPVEDPVATAMQENAKYPTFLTRSMLESVDDASVRLEIANRGYKIGESYAGAELRRRFAEEQDKARA